MTAKHIPIMFKEEMLEAVLEGRKTQTRRPVKRDKKGRAIVRFAQHDLLYVKEATEVQPNKMFMPKALAKVWLKILGVHLCVTEDISEEDARAEGMGKPELARFQALWHEMYKDTEHDWGQFALVWKITFVVTDKPEDLIDDA